MVEHLDRRGPLVCRFVEKLRIYNEYTQSSKRKTSTQTHYLLRPQRECMNVHCDVFAVNWVDVTVLVMLLAERFLLQLTKLRIIRD